jgi:hypothetical protein
LVSPDPSNPLQYFLLDIWGIGPYLLYETNTQLKIKGETDLEFSYRNNRGRNPGIRIILSKVIQAQKTKNCMFFLICRL